MFYLFLGAKIIILIIFLSGKSKSQISILTVEFQIHIFISKLLIEARQYQIVLINQGEVHRSNKTKNGRAKTNNRKHGGVQLVSGTVVQALCTMQIPPQIAGVVL